MRVSQAINYLETCSGMEPCEFSKGMFRLLRSCARLAASAYPVDQDGTIGGYYDLEFEGARANVRKFRFAAAPTPFIGIKNDPFASTLDLI